MDTITLLEDAIIQEMKSRIPRPMYPSLIDMSEAMKQERWDIFLKKLTPIENSFKKALKKYFSAQSTEMISRFQADYSESSTPKRINYWLPDKKKWQKKLMKIGKPFIKTAVITSGESTAADINNQLKVLGKKTVYKWNNEIVEKQFEFLDQEAEVVDFIAGKTFAFSKQVGEYSDDILRATLLAGLENQEDIRQLTARITTVFDFSEIYRAERIARTEIVSSLNYGSYQSAVQSGVVWGNQWLAALDSHTRDTHRSMGENQEKRKIDSPFSNGLMFPGDGSTGNLAEVVNCRCSLRPIVKKPKG